MTRLFRLSLMLAATCALAQQAYAYEYRQLLSGTRAVKSALPKPSLSMSSASLEFSATALSSGQTKQVLLTNDGAAPLTFSSLPSLSGDGAFTSTSNCPGVLQMTESCVVGVTFSPSVAGAFSASLSLAGDFSSNPVTVSLTGLGLEAVPSSSYYSWPTWYPKTDGYVNDWYTYDNNGDGQLDGTRVGSVTPGSAYVLNLSGGARTVLSVESLTPGLVIDTSAKDYPNCFQAGATPAPSWNGANVACYAYPRYTVQKAGPNKVLFRVRHTLGEDLIGMVFYGYSGPDIVFGIPATVALGPLTGSTGQYVFQASNTGAGAGKLAVQGGYLAIADAASCTGTSTSGSMEVTMQPGASCSLKVTWPMWTTSGTVTIRVNDAFGQSMGVSRALTWFK